MTKRCTGAALATWLLVAGLGLPLLAEEREEPSPSPANAARERTSLEAARRQAEILHAAMHATLQTVHHRYYEEDEGLPLPAAALQEIFAQLEKEQQVRLRWLAVEGQAMNADHKPRTDFEQAAAAALKTGRPHEQLRDGLYERAASIRLSGHCLKCHVPDRTNTAPRTAGLIIGIEVEE